MFTIETGPDGIVHLAGRLDAAQAAGAQAHLDGVGAGGAVVVDCLKLEYISSAGLGVLLKTQKRLLAKGGRLRLAGVNPQIRDIFAYSGFDQIFDIDAAG
jgi:anti-sigma B factor antagonist